ncbi:4-carboxymuconolactone decarboxylase family protein [Niveomyces insectorum RCEF 264]|uniref:4-carboxymuconolactone decarboxylase family protein n=1 Tax=Niveomyces insectorum RCEF 264 TaxID=1081102 RepID=A0A168A2E5_9HYPO|nr:4-carboxymuconolactone decarboxylase family protein [Niveomyces insectorum RCEF 264]
MRIPYLAICRVAVVNRAWYEWGAHAPLATAAGVPAAGLDVVKRTDVLSLSDDSSSSNGLSAVQWAVIVYTEEMTRNVEVADATFARLREFLNERQIVELTMVVASYNCVSRFLVALNVGEKNGTGIEAAH